MHSKAVAQRLRSYGANLAWETAEETRTGLVWPVDPDCWRETAEGWNRPTLPGV